MIKAEIVGDSLSPYEDRLSTMLVTFPRIILAELNTHRMFSRNSASSRAIPFKKMLKSVMENPFIPVAFQKDHAGMQGKEYFLSTEKFKIGDDLFKILKNNFKFKEGDFIEPELFILIKQVLIAYKDRELTLKEWWLLCRDKVAECATLLFILGITKQLANRLLEPFMWHTVLISATEWENFFALRCPQYTFENKVYRSKKDACNNEPYQGIDSKNWLQINRGQAEIHMMALAEAMWDAYNESKPELLRPGEWHIPFKKSINIQEIIDNNRTSDIGESLEEILISSSKTVIDNLIKISTVKGARTSYTVMGEDLKPLTYQYILELYEKLKVADPFHASPFEHCAQVMTSDELDNFIKIEEGKTEVGWCRNFKGFKQLRQIIEKEHETNRVSRSK